MKIIQKLRSKFAIVLISILSLAAPLGLAASASAAQAVGTAPYGPFPYTVGSPGGYTAGQWYLTFNGQYPNVTKVCTTFGFGGNLLDPGEKFLASVAGAPVTQTITNTGTTPLSSATVCFTDAASVTRFQDGYDVIRLQAVSGSVTVTSLSGQLEYTIST